MAHRISTFILSVVCLFLLFENKQTIKAEEISPTPLITMSAPTVHPGNSAYISVSINHVQNLAALSFDIYYDETYFSISSAHTGYLFNQANTHCLLKFL